MEEWRSVLITFGGQCVMMDGMREMLQQFADNCMGLSGKWIYTFRPIIGMLL